MNSKEQQKMQINTKLLELIAPQGLEIKPNFIRTGEIISKIFYVSGWASTATIGWVSNMLNISNTIFSISVLPIDQQVFIEGIDKGIQSDLAIYNSTKSEVERTRAEYKISSAKRIMEEIETNSTAYVYISITAKVSGKNEKEFENNTKIFKNRMAGMALKTRVPSFLTEEAYRSVSPFAVPNDDILKISNKNLPLMTLMGGLPFSGSGFIDTTGFYMGNDESGRMITVDFFKKERDRGNSNIAIIGTSGGGKSFATKKILLNEYVNGTKILIIDPESEYREMQEQIENSKRIDCSGGVGSSVPRINPLQISSLPVLKDDEESNKSPLSIHFYVLQTFFKLYYPEITTLENARLSEILEELYSNFNIKWETDITNFKNTDFPIMKDLYELISKKFEEDKNNIELKVLKAIIRDIALGAGSNMFNGYTTIEANSNFIVFDTSMLQGTDKKIRRCQYFNILKYCQNIAFKDKTERVYVACDEAYLLVDSNVPESLEFLRNFSKRARKYESGLIVITQSLVDFLDPSIKQYGQALFDDTAYKLFFGMDGKNLQEAQELWHFNNEESNILSSKIKGQGIFRIGHGNIFIRVIGQNWEMKYIDKDRVKYGVENK